MWHFVCFQGSTLLSSATVALSEIQNEAMIKLWHIRLGHMSERGCKSSPRQIFCVAIRPQILSFLSTMFLGDYIVGCFQRAFIEQ